MSLSDENLICDPERIDFGGPLVLRIPKATALFNEKLFNYLVREFKDFMEQFKVNGENIKKVSQQ